MEFLKLLLDHGSYSYKDASNIKMCVLGTFLATDVGCYSPTFRKWAAADKATPDSGFTHYVGGNATELEEEDNHIYLFDGTEPMTDEIRANGFKIPRAQFIQLLDDWKEKVCVPKPKEVMIKHENDQFIFETKD